MGNKRKACKPLLDKSVNKVVHSGVDFVDDHAWITVYLHGMREDDKEVDDTFVVRDDGEIFHCMIPPDGFSLDEEASLFEKRWLESDIVKWQQDRKCPELVDLVAVISALHGKYAEFADDFEPKFFALYDIMTYFHRLFDDIPYVFLTGLKGTGKTRTGKVSAYVSFNGFISTDASPSSMFRFIDKQRCTFVIDEKETSSDKTTWDANDSLINAILNGGDKKGAGIMRMERVDGTRWEYKMFDVFCPKMICNVYGALPIDTLTNRAITVIMQRALNDITLSEPVFDSEEFVNVRSQLYRFLMMRWKDVRDAYNNLYFVGNRRTITIWKPLVAIASMISEDFKKELLAYMERSVNNAMFEEGENDEFIILERLKELVTEKGFYSLSLIGELTINDITPERLGKLMKKLGFTNKRRVGKGMEYGISPEDVRLLAIRLGRGEVRDLTNKGLLYGQKTHTTSGATLPTLPALVSPDQMTLDGQVKPTQPTQPTLEASECSVGSVSVRYNEENEPYTEQSYDNKGSPEQIVEVQTDNEPTFEPSEPSEREVPSDNERPEPSRWFPNVDFTFIGKCSDCGAEGSINVTEVKGKFYCKACYSQLDIMQIDKKEETLEETTLINPSNDNGKEGG